MILVGGFKRGRALRKGSFFVVFTDGFHHSIFLLGAGGWERGREETIFDRDRNGSFHRLVYSVGAATTHARKVSKVAKSFPYRNNAF